MSALATSVQHCTTRAVRHAKIEYPGWKEGSKNYLFAVDMNLYLENPMKCKKLLNKFSRIAGYKVSIQKKSIFCMLTMNDLKVTVKKQFMIA